MYSQYLPCHILLTMSYTTHNSYHNVYYSHIYPNFSPFPVQSLPLTHYVYCLLPVVLWAQAAQGWKSLRDFHWYITDHGLIARSLAMAALGAAGLEIIVSTTPKALTFTRKGNVDCCLILIGPAFLLHLGPSTLNKFRFIF